MTSLSHLASSHCLLDWQSPSLSANSSLVYSIYRCDMSSDSVIILPSFASMQLAVVLLRCLVTCHTFLCIYCGFSSCSRVLCVVYCWSFHSLGGTFVAPPCSACRPSSVLLRRLKCLVCHTVLFLCSGCTWQDLFCNVCDSIAEYFSIHLPKRLFCFGTELQNVHHSRTSVMSWLHVK